MSKVKLMIEIEESDYKAIKNDGVQSHIALADEIIANGTPITEAKFDRPEGEFTRKELESWLYQIAFNNTDNELSRDCEEIISRLDGFERFVADMRGEKNEL